MRLSLARSIAALIALVTLAATASPGAAAQTPVASPEPAEAPKFAIGPADASDTPWFDITVEPGGSVTLTASIGNYGEAPVTLRTYATNAINPPNGGFEAATEDDTPAGPTRWTDYAADTLTIAPGRAVERAFTVSVPADTAPGEYVIALVAQTADPLAIPGTEALRQIIRSTMSIEIAVPGEMTAGFALGQPAAAPAGDQWLIDVPITNAGTARVRPRGELVVATPGGEVVATADIEMGSVYGGNSTVVRAFLPGQLPLGDYRVSLGLTDEATGATAAIADAPVTLVEPEVEEPELFTVDQASVTPSGNPVVYADVSATITNNGTTIPTATITLHVFRDGEAVERYPLAQNQALPAGTTEFTQRYIPMDDWQPGTWTFELVIASVNDGTETVLATVPIADEIVVP